MTVPEFQSLRRDVDQLKRSKASAPAVDPWSGKSGPDGNRLAEQGAEIADLQTEVARLRGEIETLRRQIEQGHVAAPPATGDGSAPIGDVAAVPSPTTGADAPNPAEGSAPAEEIRDYEEAFRRYRAADYAGAIDRFQVFLQTHPSSEYADNALFWMGESYFKQSDYEQAAVAFDKVVKRFPNGNKVPDALYRQGVSLLEIGDRTKQQKTYKPAACQIFRRITDEYPNSDRVPEARRQLEKCSS